MVRTGVVLSTGDLRGVFAHTGFLKALGDLHIEPRALAGSSAGALVAAIVGSGTPVEELAARLEGLSVRDYWAPDSILKVFYQLVIRQGRGYSGFISTRRLEETIRDMLYVKTLEECPIPVYLVATNITKCRKEVFHTGDLAPRAAASAAIPGIIKAREIEGSFFVDGGVYDLTPRSAICCREGLDRLIVHRIPFAIDPGSGENRFMREPWTLAAVVGRVLSPLYGREAPEPGVKAESCPCGCRAKVVTIVPRLEGMNRLRPREGIPLMRQGYEETMRLLPPVWSGLSDKPAGPLPAGKFPCD